MLSAEGLQMLAQIGRAPKKKKGETKHDSPHTHTRGKVVIFFLHKRDIHEQEGCESDECDNHTQHDAGQFIWFLGIFFDLIPW